MPQGSNRVRAQIDQPLQVVGEAADLVDQQVDFFAGQTVVGAVLAQMQLGHTIEIADGEVAGALVPVESQRAPRIRLR